MTRTSNKRGGAILLIVAGAVLMEGSAYGVGGWDAVRLLGFIVAAWVGLFSIVAGVIGLIEERKRREEKT